MAIEGQIGVSSTFEVYSFEISVNHSVNLLSHELYPFSCGVSMPLTY